MTKDTRRVTLDELRRMKGETDWKKVRDAGDYDGPPEFEVDQDSARIAARESKTDEIAFRPATATNTGN